MTDPETRTIVLKKTVNLEAARAKMEAKKTRLFSTLLNRPKRHEIHIDSISLNYEPVLVASGSYTADYYRKAVHTVKVDHDVREVVIGDGVFQIRTKSKLGKTLAKKGRNRVDLELEEHVFTEDTGTIHIDCHGRPTKFPYKLDSRSTENYPRKVLEKNSDGVRDPGATHGDAKQMLKSQLTGSIEPDVRDIREKFTVSSMTTVYVPVFEGRLVGPRKKIRVMRIDAYLDKVV